MNHKKPILIFITQLVFFLLPIIVAGVYLEYKMTVLPNSYNVKRSNLESQLDSIQILLMGDSHVQNNINPEFINKYAFNLANSSQTLYFDRLLLLKYIEKLPRLTDVVLHVSYFTLYAQLDETPEAWRENYYYKFWNIKGRQFNYTDFNNYSAIGLYSFKTSLRKVLGQSKIDSTPLMSKRGYYLNPFKDSSNISLKYGQDRVKVHHQFMKQSNLDVNLSLLEDIIQTLQSKNIKVHLLSCPVNECYQQFCLPEFETATKASMQQLEKKYNIRYTDLHADERFKFNDFADCDHLNPKGAIKLTKLLNEKVLEL